MIVMKRILVPTDFSEPSQIAVTYGKALAENFDASLHVLHVIEERELVYGKLSSEAFSPLIAVIEDIEKNVRQKLDAVLTESEREQYRAELVMLTGTPFVEIVRYARARSIDLIVMGTHGRGPIAHILMGSVAERVVRKAPCPVLTVRHPEHEFVMP